MKKLFLLLSVCAGVSHLYSQRISQMTVEGKPSSVPFAAFNPTNNSTTKVGDGQIVFPVGTDLSNVSVTLNVGEAATVAEPNPLPTDWTQPVTGIKVVDTATPTKWALYNITAKVLKAAPLPLEIKTGEGNFDSNGWTPETVGWAGAAIDKGQHVIRFGSANRSFVVAFDTAPDSLFYTIKALGAWDGSGNVFDVDGSEDGIHWTSIVQYNATNIMPPSSPAEEAKIELKDPKFRYIRWIYSTRNGKDHLPKPGNFNVALENIRITRPVTNSLDNEGYKRRIGAHICNDGRLVLLDNSEVAELALYSTTGVRLLWGEARQAMPLGEIPAGVYIVRMKLHNGNTVVDRLCKR